MEKNVANWDRILRAIAGIVLIGVAIMYYQTAMVFSVIGGIIGVVLLAVAITGFCPMYTLLGFQTLKKKKK